MMRKVFGLILAGAMTLGLGMSAVADSIPSSGKAVFDFDDRAFFTVKMHSEEEVYLNLDITYQKDIATQYGTEFDRFYQFKGTCDTFNSRGLLFLPGDKDQFVYEIGEDGELALLDSEYVEDYVTVGSGEKASGYLVFTKTLGNYALALSEIA